MSLDPEVHRRIGVILGYPSCCVEAFIDSIQRREQAAALRGVIVERVRSPEECAQLADEIGPYWDVELDSDPRKAYVPCAEHVGTEGWRPL